MRLILSVIEIEKQTRPSPLANPAYLPLIICVRQELLWLQ
jgi:hypothetical protein